MIAKSNNHTLLLPCGKMRASPDPSLGCQPCLPSATAACSLGGGIIIEGESIDWRCDFFVVLQMLYKLNTHVANGTLN